MFKNTGKLKTRTTPNKNVASVLKGTEINVGEGSISFKTDKQGSWWGADKREDATIAIDMDGSITIRASALTSGTAIRFYDTDDNLVIFIGFAENV